MRLERTTLFAFFTLLLIIDQFTKYLIRQFGGFYICNEGIAFGINLPSIIRWPIIIGILFFLSFLVLRHKSKNSALAFILIISGALSNILDRLVHGCVIDFIKLQVWPIFNFADVFITIGVIILIFQTLKTHKA